MISHSQIMHYSDLHTFQLRIGGFFMVSSINEVAKGMRLAESKDEFMKRSSVG